MVMLRDNTNWRIITEWRMAMISAVFIDSYNAESAVVRSIMKEMSGRMVSYGFAG